MRYRVTLLAIALGAAVTTCAVAVDPDVRLVYRSPGLHVALETAAALIASLAAYLVLGRFRARASLTDLVLVCALAALMLTNLAFAALPTAAAGSAGRGFATWASLAGSVAGALLLVLAAVLPERRLARPRRAELVAALVFCAGFAGLGLAVAVFLAGRRTGIPPALSPRDAVHPIFVGELPILFLEIAATALFAFAAAGFARRASAADELMRWVAAATVLGAFARLNYLFFPSRYSEWVSLGDLFRLAFYLVLLVGAGREIRSYWERLGESAVLEERGRLARDLHDGLAQELAYIAARAEGPLADAARRALDESRLAIAALSRPLDEPLDVLLVRAAEEVAHRYGARVRCSVERVEVEQPVREALVRIVREAVSNAARHGRAGCIHVELRDGTLHVTDDGCGFDPALPRHGFGLVGMRARAEAVGGALTVDSAPGRGARVAVALP